MDLRSSKITEQDFDKGQHFLIDLNIIKKEVDVANISKKDKIIEIGAGEGNLTSELVKKAGKVLAFEIDKRYAIKLNFLEKNNKNLKVIYNNALHYSW
jgi:16S rRNA (adenine1518-N6/adenine1519-N6)-dimethyltransferase